MENKMSFKDWCIENNREDLLNRWDYEKNPKDPSKVCIGSGLKYWFKCPVDKHESETKTIHNLVRSPNNELSCNKCKTFAQKIIDLYGAEYLNKIWNDENEKSPWDVAAYSNNKYKFNCLNNPKHVYDSSPNQFMSNQRCSYCVGKKVLPEESIGGLYPKAVEIWSDKNDKTAFEYTINSNKKTWWKCPDGKHEDYLRAVETALKLDFRCAQCTNENFTPTNFIDLTGMKFGELTVLGRVHDEKHKCRPYWYCRCSCGTEKIILGHALLAGNAITCGNRTIHWSGENSTRWQGGITPESSKIRTSLEYQEWRQKSMKRDLFTCQCCGKRGGDLEVHHINSFKEFADQRTDLSNSITLCRNCHSPQVKDSLHSIYGCIDVTPDQLTTYINNKRNQLGIHIPFNIERYQAGNILKPGDINNLTPNGFSKIRPRSEV